VVPEGSAFTCWYGWGGQRTGWARGLEVVSLLADGHGWKVLLDGRLEGIAGALAGRFGRDDRRSGLPRMEPVSEGALSTDGAPGPAGLAVPAGARAPAALTASLHLREA